MPVRVGTDLIEIDRIRRALERPGFRDRCFTPAEQAYCDGKRNPAESYAARFSGKEAVGKALGCGVRFTWKEIEIVGPPEARRDAERQDTRLRRAGRAARDRRLARRTRARWPAPCAWPTSTARRRRGAPRMPSVLEPLYTAAEMRAAEERYPGVSGHRGRADGERGRRGGARGDALVPACPQLRRGLRRRRQRRRRAHRGARHARGGSRGGRDRRARGPRCRRRRAVRDGVPRCAASGGGGADRADQRVRSARDRRRPALGRRRLHGRGRRRGRHAPRSRSPSTGARSAWSSRPGGFTPVASSSRTSGSRPSRRQRDARPTRSCAPCRSARRTTRSTPRAPCSSSAGRRA